MNIRPYGVPEQPARHGLQRQHLRALAWVAAAAMAWLLAGCATTVPGAGSRSAAQAAVKAPLIVYTARDSAVDTALLAAFGAQNGVRVERRVVARDAMASTLAKAGADQRPDVMLSNDVAALAPLLQAGALAPLPPEVLHRVPGWHGSDGRWVALTLRARGLYARRDGSSAQAQPAALDWDLLAEPASKGRVCMRTATNAYQRSMLAALIVQRGEEAARTWAQAVVANFARPPAAGDYAQVTDLHDGACALTVANHGYALWMQHDDAERKATADRMVGAPLARAIPNPGWGAVVTGSSQAAMGARLLAFLLDPQVNAAYAAATHEFPAVAGAAVVSPQTRTLGAWQPAPLDWNAVIAALPRADAVFASVGWK